MEKQKLLYQQARLHDRGAAEMVLQTISASKGLFQISRCLNETKTPFMHGINMDTIPGVFVAKMYYQLDRICEITSVGGLGCILTTLNTNASNFQIRIYSIIFTSEGREMDASTSSIYL